MSALRVILTGAISSPTLLVYLAGMILAVVYWRRCPKASLLCLLGLGLLLATTIEQLAMEFFIARFLLFDGRFYMLVIVSVTENVARAVATALLVGAIFSGRKVKHIARQEIVPIDQDDRVTTASNNITRPRSGDFVGLPRTERGLATG